MPMKKNSTLLYFVNNIQTEAATFSPNVMKTGNGIWQKAENGEMCPSDGTIDSILSFANAYEVMQAQNSGPHEMILN